MGAQEEEAATLREEGERIASLMQEVEGAVGPQVWGGVEELIQRIVQLYGAGLTRIMGHLEAAGAGAAAERIRADELLSSLLLLHGLHELPIEVRITQGLESLRPRLASQVKELRLERLDPDRTVEISLRWVGKESERARQGIEEMIRSAVEEAAPEVGLIRVRDDEERKRAFGIFSLKTPG